MNRDCVLIDYWSFIIIIHNNSMVSAYSIGTSKRSTVDFEAATKRTTASTSQVLEPTLRKRLRKRRTPPGSFVKSRIGTSTKFLAIKSKAPGPGQYNPRAMVVVIVEESALRLHDEAEVEQRVLLHEPDGPRTVQLQRFLRAAHQPLLLVLSIVGCE